MLLKKSVIFEDKKNFNNYLGDKFLIKLKQRCECTLFLNSGGVTSKTFYIPLNDFFLKILNFIDNILIKLFPNVFAMGRQIVLKKI